MGKHGTTEFDIARDELFSHIHRCGVLKAEPQQQTEWIEDTIAFLGERYPALASEELDELRAIGTRFCQPVIAHGKEHTALSTEDSVETTSEMAGAA